MQRGKLAFPCCNRPSNVINYCLLVCDVAMMREVADTPGSFAMERVGGVLAEYVRY